MDNRDETRASWFWKIIMSALDALIQVQGIELVALCVRAESIEKGQVANNLV